MKKAIAIIIPVLICFGVGFTAQFFQQDAIENWYPLLNKPELTPPNIIFPIAWSVLYLLMGISIGLIIASDNKNKSFFIKLFVIQLFLNFMWSIVFFYMQNPLLGFIDIVLLDVVIVIYIYKTFNIFRASSILFIPYLLWVLFASYLNLYILLYN